MRREEALRAWDTLWPILVEDAQNAERDARASDTPAARRSAFRTLFSCLEGAIWVQKLLPLVIAAEKPERYSSEEVALLREETYILDSHGQPKTTKRFLRIEDNLLFTVRMVAKLEDMQADIDLNAEGWQALKESIRVRHRVTHPRRPEDLDVSAEEFERLIIGYKWAVHLLQKTLAKSYLNAYAEFKRLKKDISDLTESAERLQEASRGKKHEAIEPPENHGDA